MPFLLNDRVPLRCGAEETLQAMAATGQRETVRGVLPARAVQY